MKKIRKNTKEVILESALNLFSNFGYDNTSVKEIAKKAGISHGLLYNYFDSKEELLKNVFSKGLEDLKKSFKELYSQNDSLIRFIIAIFDVFDINEDFWRLRNSLKLQKHLVKVFIREYNAIDDYIIGNLTLHLKKTDCLDKELEARYIYSVIDGISTNYLYDRKYPIEPIIKLLILKCK